MRVSRDALPARTSGASTSYTADQSQVSINMPDAFDLDSEVEGLQGQLGRLKQVQVALVSGSVTRRMCCFLRILNTAATAAVRQCQIGKVNFYLAYIVERYVQVARAIGEENVLQSQAANSLVSLGVAA